MGRHRRVRRAPAHRSRRRCADAAHRARRLRGPGRAERRLRRRRGGRLWVGVPGGLKRVDPASGEIVATVRLEGEQALQIAAGGGAVWATTITSRARRVEARTGRPTAEFYAGSFVYPIALGGGAAWVGGQAGVSRLDPDTGALLGSSARIDGVTGVAFGEHAVSITSVGRRAGAAAVVRMDPGTGTVEARIPTGAPGFDLVVHDGLVWIVVPAAPSD